MRKSGPIEDHLFPKLVREWTDINLDNLATFLTRAHPEKTAQHVAEVIGLPEATVKKWLLKAARPNAVGVFRLACGYGPEILVAMCPAAPTWMRLAAREAEQARMEARMARLRAEIERAA